MLVELQATASQERTAPGEPTEPSHPEEAIAQAIEAANRAVAAMPGGASPRALHEAAKAKREVIRDLIERARNRREEISSQLRNGSAGGADRAGLEARTAEMDARIIQLEKQLAVAEQEMMQTAGVPGAIVTGPTFNIPRGRSGPPEAMFVVVPILLVLFVLAPIAFAYARRIWKRTGTAAAALPQAVMERFTRLEQNVDTMAIEIERISEGQRFMTKLFSEQGVRAGQLRESAPPAELGLTTSAPRP